MVRRDHGEIAHRDRHRQALVQHGYESIRGIASMGMYALSLYYDTPESREGSAAFKEKRKPDFRRFTRKD